MGMGMSVGMGMGMGMGRSGTERNDYQLMFWVFVWMMP